MILNFDSGIYNIKEIEDSCPHCGKLVSFVPVRVEELLGGLYAFIMKCPDVKCGFITIFLYKRTVGNIWQLEGYYPKESFKEIKFSDNIISISHQFLKLYNQSAKAEHYDCGEVAGSGYRKALEFLIKDYVIFLDNTKREKICKLFLGKVIEDHIENKRIKEITRRAVWLGNDEAHYSRVWGNKDIADLKQLINIVVDYINMEEDYKKVICDMPGTE
jgi:hypothetical protein